jgi:hypothetical protein
MKFSRLQALVDMIIAIISPRGLCFAMVEARIQQ